MKCKVVYDRDSGTVIFIEEQRTVEEVFDIPESILSAFMSGNVQLSVVNGVLEVLNEPVSVETVGSYIPG